MYRRSANITVTTLAADASEVYTITESGKTVANIGDVVVVNPPSTAEVEWCITKAWVHARGVIKFEAINLSGIALTGGTLSVRYAVIR